MAVNPNLTWLRRLLEDVPVFEVETAAGNGTNRDFYFANPPALVAPALVVALNGVVLADTDYVVSPERDRITLTTAPAAGAMVAMRYSRQTFGDDELLTYLEAAAQRHEAAPGLVYRAAIYAIDTLLMGVATALRFGAGAEDFDAPSVFNRLMEMRGMFFNFITEEDESTGIIQFHDLFFPSADPEYPGDDVWTVDVFGDVNVDIP